MGWKILNKTGTESYKSKKRQPTPDNKLIFKDVHPAIIDEETFNIVQRLRGTKRRVYKLDGGPDPLTGVLYCADCGAKMYHKQGSSGRPNQPTQSAFSSQSIAAVSSLNSAPASNAF